MSDEPVTETQHSRRLEFDIEALLAAQHDNGDSHAYVSRAVTLGPGTLVCAGATRAKSLCSTRR